MEPDLTTLGKVIGGGLPVGAYGGRRSLMRQVAPEGEGFQAGTLSGNPLAMAAGLAALDLLAREGVYPGLEDTSARLARGLSTLAAEDLFEALRRRQVLVRHFPGKRTGAHLRVTIGSPYQMNTFLAAVDDIM